MSHITVDGTDGIAFYLLLATRGAVSLEVKGLKHSRGLSATQAARTRYGIQAKRKLDVLAALNLKVQQCQEAKSRGERLVPKLLPAPPGHAAGHVPPSERPGQG